MHSHYGGIAMGLLLSVFALSGAISGLILGYLNDVGFSLKRLVLFCIIFKIVGNVLYFIGINIYCCCYISIDCWSWDGYGGNEKKFDCSFLDFVLFIFSHRC